jgi:hypothetical protein
MKAWGLLAAATIVVASAFVTVGTQRVPCTEETMTSKENI